MQPSAFRFPTPARVALTTLTLQRAFWIQSATDHIARVDWVCGAAILARRPALEAVGGFDEQLFIYSEDPDLCLRLRDAGYATAYFPHASLVHFENATTSGVPERRIYQMERSRALYARKHHGAAGEIAVRGLTAAAFAAARGGRQGAADCARRRALKQLDDVAPARSWRTRAPRSGPMPRPASRRRPPTSTLSGPPASARSACMARRDWAGCGAERSVPAPGRRSYGIRP